MVIRIPAGATVFILAVLLLTLGGCVEKKMSLQEAKQVSVAMRQNTFVPPPRSITDILAVLEQPGHFDPEITADQTEKADALPPDTRDPSVLAQFYWKRGNSAGNLGRAAQELSDKRQALTFARTAGNLPPKEMSQLLRSLANAEIKLGNFRTGQDLCREGIDLFPTVPHYTLMAGSLYKIGEFREGDRMVQQGVALCDRMLQKAQGPKALRIRADRAKMKAMQLSALGKHQEAEPFWREIHEAMAEFKDKNPGGYLMSFENLADNLKSQGRMVEAELYIRQGLKLAMGHSGKNSTITASMAGFFAEVLLKQGRLEDAQKMVLASIAAYEGAGLSKSATRSAKVDSLLAEILFAQRDYAGAMAQFETIRQQMGENQYVYNLRIRQNRNAILCMLLTGNTGLAMEAIDDFFIRLRPFYDEKNYKSAEYLALRGMVLAQKKDFPGAVRDFSLAMPILFGRQTEGADYLKDFRRALMAQAYMDLMLSLHRSGQDRNLGVNAPLELFRLSEYLNTSTVQGALGASGARAAARDPELADLVRKEQDADQQIFAMKQSLTDLAAAATPDKTAMAALKTAVDNLSKARQALLDEIETRFPRYAEFIHPKPKGFKALQEMLAPDETMVVFFPAFDRVYVWAIPRTGKTAFATADITGTELARDIRHLRQTLAPMPGTFNDIPEFDLALAGQFYEKLLAPVKPAWQGARDLLVVAPGDLGQIPFSVLPVSIPENLQDHALLFDRYRQVDWLIRHVSITRLPSVSALYTLRGLPPSPPDRRPFIGFGDPVFNPAQLTDVRPEQTVAQRGVPLRVRGIRKVEKPKAVEPVSVTLKDLGRLPDTAEEIEAIAEVMGVEKNGAIFLQAEAAENRVKGMDLARARVLAFASHGLVPGDLDGLTQPAIALSSPEVTHDPSEDGLLEMGEILRLNLDADWVILSACNTGAAGGAGAEAVSGLGQAFFYAGTRALLVTMWSVESTSARKLTTGLFRQQKSDPALSRARALQASILDLLDREVLTFQDKQVAAYAHPFFWAPFIVVGDGS